MINDSSAPLLFYFNTSAYSDELNKHDVPDLPVPELHEHVTVSFEVAQVAYFVHSQH